MRNPAKRAFLNFTTLILLLLPAILGFFVRRKLYTKPAELFPERENPSLDFSDAAAARCLRSIINHDLRGRIAALVMPVLVLCSTNDEMIDPNLVRVLAEEIPGARFQPIENQTHFLPLEQPGPVAAAMEQFLSGAEQRGAVGGGGVAEELRRCKMRRVCGAMRISRPTGNVIFELLKSYAWQSVTFAAGFGDPALQYSVCFCGCR